MVKCPRGTPSQIKANALILIKPEAPESFSEKNFSWIYDPETGRTVYVGEENEDGQESVEEEIEYDDVLADKRRAPTAQDEVVNSFVDNILEILLTSWYGKPCIKPKMTVEAVEAIAVYSEDSEYYGEDMFYEKFPSGPLTPEYLTDMYKKRSQKFSSRERNEIERTRSKTSKKSIATEKSNQEDVQKPEDTEKPPFVPDENVEAVFSNGAWYRGRVSRKLMEGQGIYFWEDGSSFEGNFIGGDANGPGRLAFADMSVYEGAVYKAFRHGEGLQCMYDSPVMYSGEWWLGKKHGIGLMVYNEPSQGINFYKGHWENGMKEGFGYRQYPSGSKYIGHWSKGKRHGQGVMLWSNNDIYRGEWNDGLMHGYGEYTWDGFINKTLSYSVGNTYRGCWTAGKKDGHGVFKCSNGAVIETEWKNDLKDGPGAVVCCDGSVVAAEMLFKYDKPALLNDEEDQTGLLFKNRKTETESKGKKKRGTDDAHILAYLSSFGKAKSVTIPLHSPTHLIELTPHVARLKAERGGEKEKQGNGSESNAGQMVDDSFQSSDHRREEKMLRNVIMVYVNQLRQLYDEYTTIGCDKKPSFKCILVRLFLWQMFIDKEIQNKGVSLVELDDVIAKQKYLLIENPHNPFEKIEFWQFLHILIELSWFFYGRYLFWEDITFVHEKCHQFVKTYQISEDKVVLAHGFQYFLENDILAHGSQQLKKAVPLNEYKDLAPIEAMYMVYRNVGEPHTARDFLCSTCIGTNKQLSAPKIVQYLEKLPSYKVMGKNATTIGEQLMFLPGEKPFNHSELPQRDPNVSNFKLELTCFNDLKPKGVIECLAQVCPGILVDDCLINMEYKLTFLEFYLVLIKCTEMTLLRRARKHAKFQVIENYKAAREEYHTNLEEYEKQKLLTAKMSTSVTGAKKGRK